MAHRKWKEAKQLPGTAVPGNMLGCCLISFHFLWAIHPIRPVHLAREEVSYSDVGDAYGNTRQGQERVKYATEGV